MADSPAQVAALFALLTVASVWDVFQRRIPNALTIGVAASGLGAQFVAGGPRGAIASLGAAAIVLAALWIPWSKRAIGGGDLKLACGAATWIGLAALPLFALASLAAAGVLAVACYILSGRAARAEIRANLGHAALGLGARPVIASAGRVPVPAGVAIAFGTVVAVLSGR